MSIGPRVWKTGLVVVITAYLGQLIAPDWSFVAIVAAIISVQPTIGVSIEKGIDRILGTLVGAVVGILFFLLFDYHLMMLGLATITTIMICTYFQWQNAIVLACLIVVMIMLGNAGDDFLYYAGNRILLTLLGVVVGFLVNIGIFPPRPQEAITKELVEIGESIEILYNNAVLWFISKECYQPSTIETRIEKTRESINHAKQQALALKTEIGTKHIFFLQSRKKRIHHLYELTVLMNLLFERALNIHQLAGDRAKRISKGPKSEEFTHMVGKVRQLLHVISGVQSNLLIFISTNEVSLQEIIRQQSLDFQEAIKEVRRSLDSWQTAHQGIKNIRSMMELSILAYELEQIGEYQQRIRNLLLENGDEEEKEKEKEKRGIVEEEMKTME